MLDGVHYIGEHVRPEARAFIFSRMKRAFGLAGAAVLWLTSASAGQDLQFLPALLDTAVAHAEANVGRKYTLVYLNMPALMRAAEEAGVFGAGEEAILGVLNRSSERRYVPVRSLADVRQRGRAGTAEYRQIAGRFNMSVSPGDTTDVVWLRDDGLSIAIPAISRTPTGWTARVFPASTFPGHPGGFAGRPRLYQVERGTDQMWIIR